MKGIKQYYIYKLIIFIVLTTISIKITAQIPVVGEYSANSAYLLHNPDSSYYRFYWECYHYLNYEDYLKIFNQKSILKYRHRRYKKWLLFYLPSIADNNKFKANYHDSSYTLKYRSYDFFKGYSRKKIVDCSDEDSISFSISISGKKYSSYLLLKTDTINNEIQKTTQYYTEDRLFYNNKWTYDTLGQIRQEIHKDGVHKWISTYSNLDNQTNYKRSVYFVRNDTNSNSYSYWLYCDSIEQYTGLNLCSKNAIPKNTYAIYVKIYDKYSLHRITYEYQVEYRKFYISQFVYENEKIKKLNIRLYSIGKDSINENILEQIAPDASIIVDYEYYKNKVKSRAKVYSYGKQVNTVKRKFDDHNYLIYEKLYWKGRGIYYFKNKIVYN